MFLFISLVSPTLHDLSPKNYVNMPRFSRVMTLKCANGDDEDAEIFGKATKNKSDLHDGHVTDKYEKWIQLNFTRQIKENHLF